MIYNIFKAHIVEKNGLYYIRKRGLFGWFYLEPFLGRTTKEFIINYSLKNNGKHNSFINKLVITAFIGEEGSKGLLITADIWGNQANCFFKSFETKERAELRLKIYKQQRFKIVSVRKILEKGTK
jgi:hypothetical protein